MKRDKKGLLLSASLLMLLLLWRTLGAPASLEELKGLKTELWQARILLPARMARVLKLWLPAQASITPESLADDGKSEYDCELSRLLSGEEPTLSVFFPDTGETKRMPLSDYVCGVVAAEMPARYHMEALKAQAVAARTRAVWQAQSGGCTRCAGADICADSAHCQGYAGADKCRDMWGAEYAVYRDRVLKAVADTGDELICYEGEPITVMYHAMSGGKTEAAQAVFAQALPYLVSVESAGEENARGFRTDASFTFEEAAALLQGALPELQITPSGVRQTLAIGTHSPSGRVSEVWLCGAQIPATELRRALGLRSTMFTISTSDAGVTFHQQGYGHGVGMSQVGANSMAAEGADYRDILCHYYTGTEIKALK